MKFVCILVPFLFGISLSTSSRRMDYRRYRESPSVEESFGPRDAKHHSSSGELDNIQSPTMSILSHMARPYMLRPRRRSPRPQALPLQKNNRYPEPSFSPEKRKFRNRDIRPSKPNFEFGNGPVEEVERRLPYNYRGKESSLPPVYVPQRPKTIYNSGEVEEYPKHAEEQQHKETKEQDFYLEDPAFEIDDPLYETEEDQEEVRKNVYRNRPVVEETTYVKSTPYRRRPIFPNSPKREYSRTPQRGIERTPQRGIERTPQRGIERTPQRGIERIPQRETVELYSKKPFRGILKDHSKLPEREPVREYSTRFPPREIVDVHSSESSATHEEESIQRLPHRNEQTQEYPRQSLRNKNTKSSRVRTRLPEYSEPQRTKWRKVISPTKVINSEILKSRPVFNRENIQKQPSFPKFSSSVEEPQSSPTKKRPISRFASSLKNDKKLKRQTDYGHHGGHLDNNGIDFVSQSSKIQKHAGDGRIAFQIHGQHGPHSYKFGYDTGKGSNRQFRYEERDNDGEVKGRYGYYGKDGKMQIVNYSAHPKHGFTADLPKKY